jgi:sirohydrochlorin cobaltochelatase
MGFSEPKSPQEPLGVLIVGHGTRDPRGQAEFAQVVQGVAALAPQWAVEGCFLELVEPDIAAGLERAVGRGARRLAVVPLLLVEGGHARRDIPRQIASAAARHSHVAIKQTPHLGSHPGILELAERRYQQALGKCAFVRAEETLLLVVGRGTKDALANAELCSFARLRWERTRVGWSETSFLAMTEPALARALEMIIRLPFSRVVVEPHFLFQGELLDRVREMIAQAAPRWPERELLVADHLGPDEVVIKAVAGLAEAAWLEGVCDGTGGG